MVSNASDDLPLPLRPVMTTSRARGMSSVRFLRLCSRGPPIRMNALLMPANFSIQLTGKLIRKSRQMQKTSRGGNDFKGKTWQDQVGTAGPAVHGRLGEATLPRVVTSRRDVPTKVIGRYVLAGRFRRRRKQPAQEAACRRGDTQKPQTIRL